MPSKFKLVFILVGIAFIWALSFVIHLSEKQDKHKIENIISKNVKLITIFDRGLKGNQTIIIDSPDSINVFDMMIQRSKLVDQGSLNLRDNKGLCDIEFKYKDGRVQTIDLTDYTSFSKGIIMSGDYTYRNDDLLNYVMSKLSH